MSKLQTKIDIAVAAHNDGYNAALNDCILLLRKWFWATNKDARACEVEMRKLVKE